jgi:autotransporter strand-loop-strand O-heptosyltransferase
MLEKAYVLYATENYYDVVHACVSSIRAVSRVPILVYFVNSNIVIPDIDNVESITWNFDMDSEDGTMHKQHASGNFYVNRDNVNVFKLFFQRPLVIMDALKRAKTVVYIDSDSVASPYIDRIFKLYDEKSTYPYITEGVYEWLNKDGRGTANENGDLTGTLEHAVCELLGVNQGVRRKYRTTNLFVAGQSTIPFLQEWWNTCNHSTILSNLSWYAPFHEETIANVLLWKYKHIKGPEYLYMNGSIEDAIDLVDNRPFKGKPYEKAEWKKVPAKKDNLLVMHGEKRPDVMAEMAKKLRELTRIRLLFVAPHLSTGGMPAFLLKRIQSLQEHTNVEIYVVEYANHSDHFVVQKNQIKSLVKHFWTLGENKMELMSIIKDNGIDVVHLEEMVEDAHNNWPEELRYALYDPNRTWRMVETCHNVVFKPHIEKRFYPDAYAFCTPYHLETFALMPSPKYVIEFPIEKKEGTVFKFGEGKHVINVGLWTPGKNQGEAVELARQMPDVHFHFIGNQAGNFQHYWEPIMKDLPPNVHVWGERNDVGEFMGDADLFLFNSTFECNPLVIREAIGYGLPIIARNLPQYGSMFTPYITDLDPTILKEQVYEQLESPKRYEIPSNQTLEFALSHLAMYEKIIREEPHFDYESVVSNFHCVGQPFFELKGKSRSDFTVKFYDENDKLYYTDDIRINHWVKLGRRWYTKWKVKVLQDGEPFYEEVLDYKGKSVYIAFNSSSLGDTIAWMPYVFEFKKKHKCHVIVSTFKNFLFKDVYPEIQFIEPGEAANDITGMYNLGWFYDSSKEPVPPNTIPLQKAATNILGLDYQELKPRIAFTPGNNLYGKYVTIATNSTAGCKFWTREAWQDLIRYLNGKGYKVINVSKERNEFFEAEQLEDTSMENTMNVIHHSHMFIGLSSGLSWLAWALNKQVVMISNFTEADHEFECIRITNTNVCHGCWNSTEHRFDPGDWDWCPVHKGTDRQWECQKSITPRMVIDRIESLL